MKPFASLIAAGLLLAACSPQVYPLYLEVRQPSTSGMDLSRKSMSIVYSDGVNPADSSFDRSAASALARALEEDYFGGEEVVKLYRMPLTDSISLDTMHSLVMDTEGDVVFLLSSRLGEKTAEGGQPVTTQLVVYDSMGEDAIRRFSGSTVLPAPASEEEPSQAEVVGTRISKRFLSQWKTQSFSFYYFEGLSESWYDALERVSEGKMGKAIDLWMPLVREGSDIKRACAAYNLAMAFYLLEDYEMSERWLDMADKMENLSLSAGLHTRLAAKKK